MSRGKLGSTGNRFIEGALERKKGALEEPGRGGLTRIDVEGAVVRDADGRAISVEVFGVKLEVGEDALVHAPGATFQLVKLEGRDALVPV
jgi:hypothetical protein